MIVRRISSLAVIVAGLNAAGLAMALAPVRILTPEPDSVVREQVPIKVPASAVPNTSPVPGYVVVAVDGKFQAAVARSRSDTTVTYVWDTKAPTALGEQGVKDGKHEIQVTAVGQDGKPVGNTDRIEVFVQNAVRSSPDEVLLRYRFVPGVQHTYTQKILIKQSDQELYKARLLLRRTIDDLLPEGLAMVRERIDRDSTQTDQGQPIPFPNVDNRSASTSPPPGP